MKKVRMLKLAGLLEADAADPKGVKFDMETWGLGKSEKLALSCGTQVCAMGLAALSGVFKSAGLRWSIDRTEVDDCGDPACTGCGPNRLYTMEIECNGADGLEAAEELFGIDEIVAGFLFYPESYKKTQRKGKAAKLAVAKRIRGVVDGSVAPVVSW